MSAMSDRALPPAIREFIEATNAADSDRFVAAFTEDAYLSDWGREFHGHDGVRRWDGTDNIGKQSRFEVAGFEPADAPDTYILTVTVTGNGYNGTGPLRFTLRDDKIASLVIEG